MQVKSHIKGGLYKNGTRASHEKCSTHSLLVSHVWQPSLVKKQNCRQLSATVLHAVMDSQLDNVTMKTSSWFTIID